MLENSFQNVNTPFVLFESVIFLLLDFCFHNGMLPISSRPILFLDHVCPTLLCPVKPQKLTEVVFMCGLQVKLVGIRRSKMQIALLSPLYTIVGFLPLVATFLT